MIELKRTIYEEMKIWKAESGSGVLEIRGARQVGKTFAITKFAKENFDRYLYINCAESSGRIFRSIIEKMMKDPTARKNVVKRAIEEYEKDFVDAENSVIIIDEIQESAMIYNLIREIRHGVKSRVIVTGSYLGMVKEGEVDDEGVKFFLPAGDLYRIEMETLTFNEFLVAMNAQELYEETDPYGGSDQSNYGQLQKWYKIYETIGGYPAVVKCYVEEQNIDKCHRILERIINIFSDESIRYFNSIVDIGSFKALLSGIASVMLKEKRGVDYVKDLVKIMARDDTLRAGKNEIVRAISWLEAAHVIGYADKYDFDEKTVIMNQRVYFRDMGVAYRFLGYSQAAWDDINGLLAENFAYLSVNRRKGKITGDRPLFGYYQKTQGELDFYAMSFKSRKRYGIEIKTGDNPGKTVKRLYQDSQIDVTYYFRLDTNGGIAEDIITVPLYLIDKINFE